MSSPEQSSWTWGQWLVILGGAVVAALIWMGKLPAWGGRSSQADASSRNSSGASAGDGRAESERPRDGQRDWVFAGGVVEGPAKELPLSFEMPGRVKAVHVQAGQAVRAGDTLVELETELAERAVEEARLQWRIAHDQREAQAALSAPAAGDYGVRPASSAPGGPAATPRRPASNSALEHAAALAESAYQRAKLQLAKCVLRAPRDGVVLEIRCQAGEVVSPVAGEPALIFVDDGPRRVRAFVEELDALDIQPGQAATVLAAGKPDRRYQATLLECAAYVRPKSHRHLRPGERLDVRVREAVLELSNADDLLIGLPVEVYIDPRETQ